MSVGLNNTLMVVKGQIRYAVHQIRGKRFSYVLHTDVNVVGAAVTLSVFGGVMPKEWQLAMRLGAALETMQPRFQFSREAFRYGGVYYRPTDKDWFFDQDSPSLRFKVREIDEDRYQAVYTLRCHAERDIYPRG